MKDYDTIYSQNITVNDIEYIVYSCCNGKRLCLVIEPVNQSFMIGDVVLVREINNGLVDWVKSEKKSSTFRPVLLLANKIALETDKLMKKIIGLKAFL